MKRFLISRSLHKRLIEVGAEKLLSIAKSNFLFVAKEYDVRIHLYWDRNDDNWTGYAQNNDVYLASSILKDVHICFSTLFHEIGHIHCRRNGIWKAYHSWNNFKASKLTVWKAEQWIERWAEKELKKHYPTIKYKRLEDKEEARKFYLKSVEEYFTLKNVRKIK